MALAARFFDQVKLLVSLLPLSESDKKFLLAVKQGKVDWDKFVYPEAKDLPGVQWKLHNLNRMPSQKRREAANKLEDFLSET